MLKIYTIYDNINTRKMSDRMKVNVDNEYDQLKSVVVSSAAYYDPTAVAINNETIKYYAENGRVPTKESILLE